MKHFIQIGNKKYEYSITPTVDPEIGDDLCYFECEAANIGQEFVNSDIPALLEDLPHLIEAEQNYQVRNSAMIQFRLSQKDKETIQENSKKYGFKSTSDFLKTLGTNPDRILQTH